MQATIRREDLLERVEPATSPELRIEASPEGLTVLDGDAAQSVPATIERTGGVSVATASLVQALREMTEDTQLVLEARDGRLTLSNATGQVRTTAAQVLWVGAAAGDGDGDGRPAPESSMDDATYWKSIWALRRNYGPYRKAYWSFDPDEPPADRKQRELWTLVAEGKYRALRNQGWFFTFLATPLLAAMTVFGLVVAVTGGGLEWIVFLAMLVGFLLCARNARDYRRTARELAARLKTGS